MNKTESRCYHCQAVVRPIEIKPPERRGPHRSHNQHECNAPDCHSHGGVDGIAAGVDRMNFGQGPQRMQRPGPARGRGYRRHNSAGEGAGAHSAGRGKDNI